MVAGAASASAVLEHVCGAIVPASAAMASVAGGEPLARWLAGARHQPRPRVARPTVIIAGADHGVLEPGPGLGREHPSAIAAEAIASGDAAVTRIALGAGARVVLLDGGLAVEAAAAIGVVPWRATADLVTRAAMTPAMAVAALEGGVAAATALIEDGADLLVLGAIGVGGDVAAAALIAALTGDDPPAADDDVRALVAEAVARFRVARGGPGESAASGSSAGSSSSAAFALAALAELGGGDVGALAGVTLTAAGLHVPVIVDGVVALAAALLASALAPAVGGYLLAAHAGGGPAAARARAALGLTPVVGYGLGRGDGAGGALALPVVLAAASGG
jgi:nicotinate-nucleotide--dimethylbenzimidazole phosphoribosyltransferase